MPGFPVLKAASYVLVHAPSTMLELGTTIALERSRNPQSEYLVELSSKLREFSEAAAYPPNQVFIGNLTPAELRDIPRPWHQKPLINAQTEGKFGAVWPEGEFFAVLKIVDTFDLVQITPELAGATREPIGRRGLFSPEQLSRLEQTVDLAQVEGFIKNEAAVPLYIKQRLVGCVRRAHETDQTLQAHVVFENLVSKASGVLAIKYLFAKNRLNPGEVEYLIECSEEAVGDMNQRGGGNLAKAIGEQAGCMNASGADIRAFCAGPAHALINAAGLVHSGIFRHVVVLAGGAPAKLGLNSRDHISKGVPVLEDVLGAFALWIGQDDGKNPLIRTDAVGRHRIASGSSPQSVMQALVVEPLEKVGLKISDVDTYVPELQNPEITVPAGAGDVPLANYRMIAALAVRRGEIERGKLDDFVREHGVVGYAPTQGHIPSGVPYLGHLREDMLAGSAQRAMLIGKGSLFLGRMTDLFDGASLLLEANTSAKNHKNQVVEQTGQLSNKRMSTENATARVGLTLLGSELGVEEMLRGADLAIRYCDGLELTLIGGKKSRKTSRFRHYPLEDEGDASRLMEKLLDEGEIDAAVTMHYSFPLGVATVGRAITPGRGKEMFISTTTGTLHTDRVTAMVLNAVAGAGVAKACGIREPSLGIVNLEGGLSARRELKRLAEQGYRINWGVSQRSGGGELLRGNDLLSGQVDVAVTDTLTGNLLMKLFSAYSTGGGYEALGYGYGPGVGPILGQGYNKLIMIVSRASGAPVVAGTVRYAAELIRGRVKERVAEEYTLAGLNNKYSFPVISEDESSVPALKKKEPKEIITKNLTAEIPGIDILELENALDSLINEGIPASSGMGCTGPVLLVSPTDLTNARIILADNGFIYA